jgi:hypothetical protein
VGRDRRSGGWRVRQLHLVPLSLARIDERVVLATGADSITARNLMSQRHARLGRGPTRDVVMIAAELEQVYALGEVPDDLGRRYARQADWDPRKSGDRMRFWCYAGRGSRPGGRSMSRLGVP